ncbi:MAG: tRNA (adenosine(37)-N6)-threonylcarbamoyltransferase complex ATPase subunit type 1 TsaE [Rhodospirillales bacterium]|nr:tRNA (adenosine(37)-N6)-threonylcarbamoyltransferase complex ATPase subunit type 1 TsaE [Rhodospirillales bacterium]
MITAAATSASLPDTVRTLDLPDEAATLRLGEILAAKAMRRDVIALQGPLGAGKTAFARGFIAALARRHGVNPPSEVPSPTFTLVQTYALGPVAVWHFDLYRISDADDAIELGLDEALAEGICLIEWPDRLGQHLPKDRLDLALAYGATDGARVAILTGHGAWAERIADVA